MEAAKKPTSGALPCSARCLSTSRRSRTTRRSQASRTIASRSSSPTSGSCATRAWTTRSSSPGASWTSPSAEKSVPNAIPNVAAALAGVLEARNAYGKVIKISNGNTPVAEVIASMWEQAWQDGRHAWLRGRGLQSFRDIRQPVAPEWQIGDGVYGGWEPHWMFAGEILNAKERGMRTRAYIAQLPRHEPADGLGREAPHPQAAGARARREFQLRPKQRFNKRPKWLTPPMISKAAPPLRAKCDTIGVVPQYLPHQHFFNLRRPTARIASGTCSAQDSAS